MAAIHESKRSASAGILPRSGVHPMYLSLANPVLALMTARLQSRPPSVIARTAAFESKLPFSSVTRRPFLWASTSQGHAHPLAPLAAVASASQTRILTGLLLSELTTPSGGRMDALPSRSSFLLGG
eukprot:scaffold32795_cov35-Tisochrysis_lutea.AAC.1